MIRFYNARILTMAEGNNIQFGEVWTKDDKIVYVGTLQNKEDILNKIFASENEIEREIDCQGNVLMPGFKNAHTHSAMTLMRSYADDLPLQDWLNTQIFPLEAKLDQDMIYELTKLAVLEYLTSGVTSIFDMYLTPETTAKACEEMGMRCVLVGNVNNFCSSPEYTEELYLKMNGKHPLTSFVLGFHAEYTCSKELLTKIADLGKKYKAPIYAHISETESEVAECIERYGMTPPMFLDSLGMFEYGGGGYHCIYLTEEDMELFAKKGLYVVTNPGSNTKLASGIAPIEAFLEKNIPIAIGTDGPASNNCLDMFREMFLVTGLAKLREKNAAAVDAFQVLEMATKNGAKAMGLMDCDVLAEGKQADMIMIDLAQPNMQPLHNIPKNIVYSGSKQNVKMTMIAGKILYEDGKFAEDIDVNAIYETANKLAKQLTQE